MRTPGRRQLGLALAGVATLAAVVALSVVAQSPDPVDVRAIDLDVADGIVLDVATYRLRAATDPMPALLLAHGFGSDRLQMDGAAREWARRGFVVTTWSARGFGRSGGQIGLADPQREISDVSTIITVLADDPGVRRDAPGDPVVGVAGGSYGGGTALLAAIDDPRIDAVAAVAAWHDLARSLSPGGVLKSQWASLLFTSARLSGSGVQGALDAAGVQVPGRTVGLPAGADPICGRFDPDVCRAYADSAIDGRLSPAAEAIARRASPAGRLGGVRAPVMLVHGLSDDLFGPEEALDSARELDAAGAPVALRLIRAGHIGLGGPQTPAGQHVAEWLDRWLAPSGGEAPPPPAFGWVDQVSGVLQTDDALPVVIGAGGGSPDEGDQVLTLRPDADGGLSQVAAESREGAAPEGRGATMTHPAAGLPASLSVLPGIGGIAGLDGLLPLVDVPGQALSFSTPALDEDLVLLGQPTLRLQVSATDRDGRPVPATAFVKLLDVTPGGRASLIGAAPAPVRVDVGDADRPVAVRLGVVAHRVVAGNRLRLVVATTDQAFASGGEAAAVTVQVGGPTAVHLPLARVEVDPGLPTALGLLLPVALLVLAITLTMAWVRRDEAAMRAAIPSGPTPSPGDADLGPGMSAAVDDPAPVVIVRGVVKAYADGKVAVDGLDLTVRRGQVFGLLGPNGAGKTTAMRMLLGLAQPTSGRIELLGTPIRPGHPVLERVGVLVEGPGFAPHLTGRQNLQSHWRAGGRPDGDASFEEAIAVADLGPAVDRPVRTYSHGMRQRLAIAQALLGDPELLVLDEPTDGLDPEQIRAMRELLARLGDRGLTILVSSHLLAEVEQMCTHVAVMQQGRVVTSGSVASLVGATRSIVVRTDDRARTRELLVDAYGPAAVTDEADGVAVALDAAVALDDARAPDAPDRWSGAADPGADDADQVPLVAPADVVDLLVRAGVRVQSVTPRGRLEDTFLALTGAGATRRAEEGRAAAQPRRREADA